VCAKYRISLLLKEVAHNYEYTLGHGHSNFVIPQSYKINPHNVQFCRLFHVPIRLYGDSRNNTSTASLHLQQERNAPVHSRNKSRNVQLQTHFSKGAYFKACRLFQNCVWAQLYFKVIHQNWWALLKLVAIYIFNNRALRSLRNVIDSAQYSHVRGGKQRADKSSDYVREAVRTRSSGTAFGLQVETLKAERFQGFDWLWRTCGIKTQFAKSVTMKRFQHYYKRGIQSLTGVPTTLWNRASGTYSKFK
jgi:hypothetical protein